MRLYSGTKLKVSTAMVFSVLTSCRVEELVHHICLDDYEIVIVLASDLLVTTTPPTMTRTIEDHIARENVRPQMHMLVFHSDRTIAYDFEYDLDTSVHLQWLVERSLYNPYTHRLCLALLEYLRLLAVQTGEKEASTSEAKGRNESPSHVFPYC